MGRPCECTCLQEEPPLPLQQVSCIPRYSGVGAIGMLMANEMVIADPNKDDMVRSGLQGAHCSIELDDVCTFLGVATFGESVVVASNTRGEIWRSTNRGHNWTSQQISSSILGRIDSVGQPGGCDRYVGICVGTNGQIYRTTDRGMTWGLVPSGTSDDLLAVRLATSLIGYCVGRNGVILKTIDGGVTWVSISSPTANDLQSVDCASPDIVAVVGDNATAILSLDGGETWLELPSITDHPKAVVCFSAKRVIVFANYDAPPPSSFYPSVTKCFKQFRFNGETTTIEQDVVGRSVMDAVRVPTNATPQDKWCVDSMRWVPEVTNDIVAVGYVWQNSLNPNRTLDTGWDGGLVLVGDGVIGPGYLSFGVVADRGLYAVCCPRKGVIYHAGAHDNIAPYDGFQYRDQQLALSHYDTPLIVDASMVPGSAMPTFGTLNQLEIEELSSGGNDNQALAITVDWTTGSVVNLLGMEFPSTSLCLVFPKSGGPVSTIPVPPVFLTQDEHFCGPIASCDIRVMSREVPDHSLPEGANFKGDWNPRFNAPSLNLDVPGALGDCYRISRPYIQNHNNVIGDAWQENDFLYYGPPIGSAGQSRWRRVAAPQIWITAIGIAHTPGGTFTDGTGASVTLPAGWRPIPRYPSDGGGFRVVVPPVRGLGTAWHTFATADPAWMSLRDDRGLIVGNPTLATSSLHYHANQPGDWSVGFAVCLWGSRPNSNYRITLRLDNVCMAWRNYVISRGY